MIADIFSALGYIQNNGGMLAVFVALFMRVEHVKDLFHRHEEIFHGERRKGTK